MTVDIGSEADIAAACGRLGAVRTRGELGSLIALLVLSYSSRDLRQMVQNFSLQIADVEPGYRARVTEKIGAPAGHLPADPAHVPAGFLLALAGSR